VLYQRAMVLSLRVRWICLGVKNRSQGLHLLQTRPLLLFLLFPKSSLQSLHLSIPSITILPLSTANDRGNQFLIRLRSPIRFGLDNFRIRICNQRHHHHPRRHRHHQHQHQPCQLPLRNQLSQAMGKYVITWKAALSTHNRNSSCGITLCPPPSLLHSLITRGCGRRR
jgi:hypothetical protein